MYDNKIGKRIKEYRKQSQITSESLAELIGVSTVYMRRIENGAELPGLDTICSISKVFGVLPRALLSDRKSEFPELTFPSMSGMTVEEIQTFIELALAFQKETI